MTSNQHGSELSLRLRDAYLSGKRIPDLIREEPDLREKSPSEIMLVFMSTFFVRLSDVSCIDGWWPPDCEAEVTDENLDLFVREAIESHRAEWER